MTDEPANPVVASRNPMAGTVPTTLRYLVTMLAAMALNHFFQDGNITAQGIALVGCILPWAWGLGERVYHNLRTRRLINMLPDEKARFK